MRVILVALVSLGFLPVLGFAQVTRTAFDRREAHYDQLIRDLVSPPPGTLRVQLAESIGAYGAVMAPRLQKLLDHPDPLVARYSCVALSRMGGEAGLALAKLSEIARQSGHPIQAEAIIAIGSISVEGAGAIDVLQEILARDQQGDEAALVMFAAIPLRGHSTLIFREALRHPLPSVRREAMMMLDQMQGDVMGVADDIAAACDQQDDEFHELAFHLLVSMGSESQSALLQLSRSALPPIRQRAIASLAVLASLTEKTLDELLVAAGEDDPLIRFWAARGLLLGGHRQDVIERLVLLSSDDDADVRWQAIRSLCQIDSRADEVVQCLRTGLRDRHPAIRLEAAVALWKVTGQATESLAVLRELTGETSSVGRASVAALRRIKDTTPR